eukprot:TRINITY_DN1022_c0_g1_i3.p1 TRINITY_DN1022_c0_g1~~TRINITY_DN1022_c0_g1_i3.p1  ORF type:complete len:524 (+),score=25.63 TRINITY_DN1022_c0_g1_i3:444-2015(+)
MIISMVYTVSSIFFSLIIWDYGHQFLGAILYTTSIISIYFCFIGVIFIGRKLPKLKLLGKLIIFPELYNIQLLYINLLSIVCCCALLLLLPVKSLFVCICIFMYGAVINLSSDISKKIDLCIAISIVNILLCYIFELLPTDISLYIYVPSLLGFSSGMVYTSRVRDDIFFLFSHIILLIIAQDTNQYIINIFGSVGILFFSSKHLYLIFKPGYSDKKVLVITRVFGSMILLSLSLKSHQEVNGGSMEFILATLELTVFVVASVIILPKSKEPMYLIHLVTNLGIVYISHEFDYDISAYIFTLKGSYMLMMVGSCGIITNIVTAFLVTSDFNEFSQKQKNLYNLYRIVLCITITMASIPFKTYSFVYSALGSLIIYLWLVLFLEHPDYRSNPLPALPHYFLTVIIILLSEMFEVVVLYSLAIFFHMYVMKFFFSKLPIFFSLSLFTMLLSVVLDTWVLAAIGGICIFASIVKLGNKLFKKNSLIFPFALILFGGISIVLTMQYQVIRAFILGNILYQIPIDTYV